MAHIITAEEAISITKQAAREVLPQAVIQRCNQEILQAAREGRNKTSLSVSNLVSTVLVETLEERNYKVLVSCKSKYSNIVDLTIHWNERDGLVV